MKMATKWVIMKTTVGTLPYQQQCQVSKSFSRILSHSITFTYPFKMLLQYKQYCILCIEDQEAKCDDKEAEDEPKDSSYIPQVRKAFLTSDIVILFTAVKLF